MPDGATSIQPTPSAPMPPGKAAEAYIKLRDKVNDIAKRHKEELEPYAQMMGRLEGMLLDHLNTSGVDSIKSGKATVFKSTVTSVTVKEWEKTLAFVREHELWDLLEARVSKTAATEYMQETQVPIPGVSVSSATVLRVRRT